MQFTYLRKLFRRQSKTSNGTSIIYLKSVSLRFAIEGLGKGCTYERDLRNYYANSSWNKYQKQSDDRVLKKL